jgi:putative ABC transport system permease protein
MLFWKIAFRNVKKNWRHSLSALLSISAAFVSLVLFDGYIDDLKAMYEDSFRHRSMLGDFIIEKPAIHSKEGAAEPWKFQINEQEQKSIDEFLSGHPNEVRSRVRFINFSGMITNGMQSTIFIGRGYDVQEGEKVRGKNWSWNTTYGKPLHTSTESANAILGHGLARKMGCSWSPVNFNVYSGGYEPVDRPFDCPSKNLQISTMTSSGQLNALDVNVLGLMDAGYRDIDDRYFITSLETAQAVTNSKDVTMISVELANGADHDLFLKEFREHFEPLNPDLKIMTWIDHPVGETYVKSMDILSVFRNFVVIVILVISVLSVINTLIKIIKERSQEIGTLRSIGFTSLQVVQMFVYETLLLTLVGILIGIFFSFFLTGVLNGLHIRYKAGMLSEPVLFKISVDVFGYIRACVVLMFVSVLACLYSTRQEVRKKVVENFSHV